MSLSLERKYCIKCQAKFSSLNTQSHGKEERKCWKSLEELAEFVEWQTNVQDIILFSKICFFGLNDAHACTHTHTCNPHGPDFSHSHTCFNLHTKILPIVSGDKETSADDSGESVDEKSKKRPVGNREAVRKYCEKKKSHAASLEDEVVRLRTLNQQLVRKLQGQAALEAEFARLKCLLVDIRGRIEGEIGSFPYQKSVKRANGLPSPIPSKLNLWISDESL